MNPTLPFTLNRAGIGHQAFASARPEQRRGLPLELAVIVVMLFASSLTVTAQNGLPQVETNLDSEVMELIDNSVSESFESAPANNSNSNQTMQTEETESLADTNDPSGKLIPPAERESRRQWLSRQRSGVGGASSDSALASGQALNKTAAQADGVPVRPAFSMFQQIAQGNIFDPNRRSRSSGPRLNTQPTKASESFALVGLMSYEKGTFAFFDGTSSSYRKTLKNDDSIAGYKVTEITPDAVKLAAGTNQVELHVGMKLRRESGGEWILGSQSEAFGAAPVSTGAISTANTSNNPAQAAAGGADNDVLERLRKKREQE